MKILSKLFVALFLVVTMAFSFAGIASADVPRADWSQTCYDQEISGGILFAICEDATGYPTETSINTDDFIGNIDGMLMTAETYGGSVPLSNWSQTCYDQEISGGVLYAICEDATGYIIDTSIDTDEFIGNIDGILMTYL